MNLNYMLEYYFVTTSRIVQSSLLSLNQYYFSDEKCFPTLIVWVGDMVNYRKSTDILVKIVDILFLAVFLHYKESLISVLL